MSKIIIEVKNATKKFKDKVLFENISLDICRGESYYLVGPSGSGKSIFLKSLVGLIPLSSGMIRYEKNKPLPEIRSKIHYIGQFPSHTEGKVRDFIEKVFQFGVYKDQKLDNLELEEMLKFFNIKLSILDKEISHLSGGEFQIIRLIRSLLLKPEALLLDESSSGMDKKLKQKYEEMLIHLNQLELTLLSVSHDQDHLDRMKGKKIVFNETPCL